VPKRPWRHYDAVIAQGNVRGGRKIRLLNIALRNYPPSLEDRCASGRTLAFLSVRVAAPKLSHGEVVRVALRTYAPSRQSDRAGELDLTGRRDPVSIPPRRDFIRRGTFG